MQRNGNGHLAALKIEKQKLRAVIDECFRVKSQVNEANEALLLLKKLSKQELKEAETKNETFASDLKNREQVLLYEKGTLTEEVEQLTKQKAESEEKHFTAQVHEKSADKDLTQKDTEISILKKKIENMRRQHKERKELIA